MSVKLKIDKNIFDIIFSTEQFTNMFYNSITFNINGSIENIPIDILLNSLLKNSYYKIHIHNDIKYKISIIHNNINNNDNYKHINIDIYGSYNFVFIMYRFDIYMVPFNITVKELKTLITEKHVLYDQLYLSDGKIHIPIYDMSYLFSVVKNKNIVELISFTNQPYPQYNYVYYN